MTATCQPLPKSVAEEMLQVVARALCDQPGDNAGQRDSRTRQMVYATMGFEPRDGLEYMLSTMVFGHFNMLLDSMRDVLQGQMDSMKARTKTTIVALDRSMLGFVKEFRSLRSRPLAHGAEDAWRPVPEQAAGEMTPEAVGLPPEAMAEAEPATAPVESPATEAPFAAMETPPAAAAPNQPTANSGLARDERAPTIQTTFEPVWAAPPVTRAPMPDAAKRLERIAPAMPGFERPGGLPPMELEDGTIEDHIAAFQDALVAMAETLTEARARDGAPAEAMAAHGD
jgi:hypothetical protein